MHTDTSRHHNPQVTDYNMARSMTAYIRSGLPLYSKIDLYTFLYPFRPISLMANV